MGGAVSSGESNDDLIDNLLEADYIKSPLVERVFRAVDRAFYYTEPYKQNAYKDLAWKDGNLHLSAPCIYSEVLENLDLRPGMCFLNIGSGTGYFSTMCGLVLGKSGMNHGVELYADVVNYARMKLEEFQRTSPALDEFDFCPPEFTVGNCLDAIPASKRYDRIYCGAACPNDYVGNLVDMLKIGGMCIVPLGDSLVQITRTEEKKDDRKVLLPVSFATLISPNKENAGRPPVELPEWSPKMLTELCRSEIRASLRQTINYPEPKSLGAENRKKKRRRRQERRRASRLVVVQRRRSVGELDGGENGFVAIACSMESNSNSSDEDRNQNRGEANGDNTNQDQNESSATSSEDSQDGGNDAESKNKLGDSDTIMEEEEEPKIPDESTEAPVAAATSQETGAASASAGNSAASGRVAVVTGSCPIFSPSPSNGKSVAKQNGNQSDTGGQQRPERNGSSANTNSPSGSRVVNTNTTNGNRRGGSGRSYTSGAESLLGRVRELLVRARQHELESVRRQFRRSASNSDAENSRSRSASGRGEDPSDDASNLRENGRGGIESFFSDVTSSDSSPSASATSTSDDEGIGENGTDGGKKRCRNESGENCKNGLAAEPKPDPLIVNPCSVQMRRKIIELPLPPALKVYLNHDRKLYY